MGILTKLNQESLVNRHENALDHKKSVDGGSKLTIFAREATKYQKY